MAAATLYSQAWADTGSASTKCLASSASVTSPPAARLASRAWPIRRCSPARSAAGSWS